MTIWKNTCGESWQHTIENGWEVSGKPGAFLFFIPKGALTHHLLKQAVVALPLVGHVRSSRTVFQTVLQRGRQCRKRTFPVQPALYFALSAKRRGGILPPHPADCLRKSATGSFVAVMGASCFVTHPFSFLLKRNKKKGR